MQMHASLNETPTISIVLENVNYCCTLNLHDELDTRSAYATLRRAWDL